MRYPITKAFGLIVLLLLICSCANNFVADAGPEIIDESGISEQKAMTLYQKAVDLMRKEEYGNARGKYKKITKKYPDSSLSAAAQFGTGETYYHQRNYKKAFEAYSKLLNKHHSFPDMETALERQFEIAGMYYNKKPKKLPVLTVKVPAKRKPAIGFYEEIIREVPFSKHAETARYRVGRIYDDYNNYDEAIAAYVKLLEEFPNGKMAPDALYRLGRCYVGKTFGRRYDELSLEQAVIMFATYLRRYPDGEKAVEIKRTLGQLDERAAYGNYEIALFYDKKKKYMSAKIYYLTIINDFPDTQWADVAVVRVNTIDAIESEKTKNQEKSE
jgi:outer membrane protein assembly factor BamD